MVTTFVRWPGSSAGPSRHSFRLATALKCSRFAAGSAGKLRMLAEGRARGHSPRRSVWHRAESAVPRPIRPGDEIRIGDISLTFRSERFAAASAVANPTLTQTRISQAAMVMAVGDIINYSTISQVTDEGTVARSLHTLWREVRGVLQAHQGTLNHYAGDAIFAIWEASRFSDAAELAVDFAVAANRLVEDLARNPPANARTTRLANPDGLRGGAGHGRAGSDDPFC